ncbi:TPA: dihydroorotate dehydrogenase (quinone), partial [Campylobacter coli]
MLYNFIKPLLFKLDPENAHALVEGSLRSLNATLSGSLSFFAY